MYVQKCVPLFGATSNNFNLFSAGLAYNYYSKDAISNFTYLLKLGLGYRRTINTDLYNTSPVSQEHVDKDSLGTTTRKTVFNYSVYTEPICADAKIVAYADAFFLLDTSPVGLHVFPEYQVFLQDDQIFNIGLGLIASFRNLKKDSPAINMEVFAKFNSIGLDKVDENQIDRFNLGIKFSLPFAFF